MRVPSWLAPSRWTGELCSASGLVLAFSLSLLRGRGHGQGRADPRRKVLGVARSAGGVVDVRPAAQLLEVQARVDHAGSVEVAVDQPIEQVAVVEPATLHACRAAGVADDID